jgi:aspartate 1-decarboxylase
VLNGAAARTCQVGDELIIAARASVSSDELRDFVSRVVIFCDQNRVLHRYEHRLLQDGDRRWTLSAQADK